MAFYRIRALVLILALLGCYSGESADNTSSTNNESKVIISINIQFNSKQQASHISDSNLAVVNDKCRLMWRKEFMQLFFHLKTT